MSTTKTGQRRSNFLVVLALLLTLAAPVSAVEGPGQPVDEVIPISKMEIVTQTVEYRERFNPETGQWLRGEALVVRARPHASVTHEPSGSSTLQCYVDYEVYRPSTYRTSTYDLRVSANTWAEVDASCTSSASIDTQLQLLAGGYLTFDVDTELVQPGQAGLTNATANCAGSATRTWRNFTIGVGAEAASLGCGA